MEYPPLLGPRQPGACRHDYLSVKLTAHRSMNNKNHYCSSVKKITGNKMSTAQQNRRQLLIWQEDHSHEMKAAPGTEKDYHLLMVSANKQPWIKSCEIDFCQEAQSM